MNKLTQLSLNYIKKQQRTPVWYEMFYRSFDLTTRTGRCDFRLYWKLYKRWTIEHLHWFLIGTLKGIIKIKKENKNEK